MKNLKIKMGDLVEYLAEFKKEQLLFNKEIDVSDINVSIQTPTAFAKINHIIKKESIGKNILFSNGKNLKCADNHILYRNNIPVFSKDLKTGDIIDTIDSIFKIESIEDLKKQNFYDVGLNFPHLYVDSSGIIHHNTFITAVLSHKCEKYGRTIVIVPNKSLVTQTEKSYKALGLDVGVFYGDRKETNHKHVISTWQSLHVLNKASKKNPNLFEDFKKDMVAVIVDEVHALKDDNVLKDLLTGPFASIPIRWGLTGTVPDEKKQAHLYESITVFIGPVVKRITTKELQDKDVLSKCFVNIYQIKDGKSYTNYQDEVKYLLTNKTRLLWISDLARKRSSEGNTLILVNRISTGKELLKLIPGSIFISGQMGNKERTGHYDSINDGNNMTIIATYGVAAVGIDIPRIFNLILLEPGKSFVRVIQSIGRGIRKAVDKDFINIDDVCSTCRFSKKHLAERISMYEEAEYPYSIAKVDLPDE